MSVYISKFNKNDYVSSLSEELRNDIMIAVENKFNDIGLKGDEFQKSWNDAFNSRVCDLEDTINIEYAEEKFSFYVVENLRFEQDKSGNFSLTRHDKLEDAIKTFNELPANFTSALGGTLGKGEIDFIHRVNGEAVLVNDFKFVEAWDNPLVHRALEMMKSRLGVEYESDVRMFIDHSVLVPLQNEKPVLNSYFMDKYLLPQEDAEKAVILRYGSPDQYPENHPVHTEHFNSAVNEVFVGGQGWIKGEDFFNKLNSINSYENPERLKVMKININYIDMNGRTGQADINPHEFALLRKQTIERTAQHPDIDAQIDAANKVRQHNMEKGKNKSKDKNRDEEIR